MRDKKLTAKGNIGVRKRTTTQILILEKDDPKRELDFEIRFQLSLTPFERYEIMDRLVRDGLELMMQHGYSTTPKIITRL